MSSYLGRHAKLYDLFYADKPYIQEADFINQCLKRHYKGSPINLLELACGTGRHALALSKLGYEVTATDYSKDMLHIAQQHPLRSGINFLFMDMKEISFSPSSFDVVVCLFDSIGYVQTDKNLAKVFRGVRKVLKPGGVFICEFWHAPAMLTSFEPFRRRKWRQEDKEIIRESKTSLDKQKRLATVKYTIHENFADGTQHSFSEEQVNRFFEVDEMTALLRQSSLEPCQFLNGFQNDENITADTWHVLAMVRKSE